MINLYSTSIAATVLHNIYTSIYILVYLFVGVLEHKTIPPFDLQEATRIIKRIIAYETKV